MAEENKRTTKQRFEDLEQKMARLMELVPDDLDQRLAAVMEVVPSVEQLGERMQAIQVEVEGVSEDTQTSIQEVQARIQDVVD